MTTPRNKGFTLIELLVVITIIGMLASIILVALNGARVKAKKAKARDEVAQIVRAAIAARILTQGTLLAVTGSNCSACYGQATSQTSITNIANKSALTSVAGILTDPWGGYYTMDENEGENGSTDCRRDAIYASGEPDTSTAYSMDYFTPYCQAHPAGTLGWQADF